MRHTFTDLPAVGFGGSAFGRLALLRALNEWKDGASEIGGNNRGKYVAKYLNSFVAEGNSWCAAFVSWCYSTDKGEIPFPYSMGALSLRNIFRKNGWLHFDDPKAQYLPGIVSLQPGDYICFERGTRMDWVGHAALCHHKEGNLLHTVEGNRSSKVEGFSYDLTQELNIIAVGRVPDTATLAPIRSGKVG